MGNKGHDRKVPTGAYASDAFRTHATSPALASQYSTPCWWASQPPPELFCNAAVTRCTCWNDSAVSSANDDGDGRVRLLGISPICPEMKMRSSACRLTECKHASIG